MKSFHPTQRVSDTSAGWSCLKKKSQRTVLELKWELTSERKLTSAKKECPSGTTCKAVPLVWSYLDKVTEKTWNWRTFMKTADYTANTAGNDLQGSTFSVLSNFNSLLYGLYTVSFLRASGLLVPKAAPNFASPDSLHLLSHHLTIIQSLYSPKRGRRASLTPYNFHLRMGRMRSTCISI